MGGAVRPQAASPVHQMSYPSITFYFILAREGLLVNDEGILAIMLDKA